MEQPKRHVVYARSGALVFSLPGIWFLLGAAVLGAAFRFQVVALLAASLAMLWLVSWLWALRSPLALQVKEALLEQRVFPGEEILSRLSVANGKWLPVPWTEVERPVEGGLLCLPGSPYRRSEESLVCRLGWLPGRQEAGWQVAWRAGRRGAYRAQPATLRCGDPASFFYREIPLPSDEEELLVYPRLFSLPEMAPGWQEPPGERRAADFRFTDPLLVAGVRDYQAGDPLRRINWVASARSLALKANLWEGSVQVRSLLCLETASLRAAQWEPGKQELAFELLVSAAASLACDLATGAGEVGFLSDLPVKPGGKPCYLPPATGRGQRHLVNLLETMARLQQAVARPPAELAGLVRLPARCNLLVFTACWSEKLAGRWQEVWPGRRITWLALAGVPRDSGGLVQPLFPAWEKDGALRELVLPAAEGGGAQ